MAAFNFNELSPRLTHEELLVRLNNVFGRLRLVLQGIRRAGDGGTVFEREIEVEHAGRGLILTTPDGTKRYRISVNNAGTVTSTLL